MGQAQVPAAVTAAAGHIHGLYVALAEAIGVVGMVQLHRDPVDAGMGAGHSQQQAHGSAPRMINRMGLLQGWECSDCSSR
jgi:hypothetical protein